MLNKIILIGRLTADPTLRYTPSQGTPVCQFTLAVDRMDDGTDFINIVVWNKQAETSAQYLSKGKLAAVVGRLQIRDYTKDGQKRWITEVVAETVRFLSPKSSVDDVVNALGGQVVDREEVPF